MIKKVIRKNGDIEPSNSNGFLPNAVRIALAGVTIFNIYAKTVDDSSFWEDYRHFYNWAMDIKTNDQGIINNLISLNKTEQNMERRSVLFSIGNEHVLFNSNNISNVQGNLIKLNLEDGTSIIVGKNNFVNEYDTDTAVLGDNIINFTNFNSTKKVEEYTYDKAIVEIDGKIENLEILSEPMCANDVIILDTSIGKITVPEKDAIIYSSSSEMMQVITEKISKQEKTNNQKVYEKSIYDYI